MIVPVVLLWKNVFAELPKVLVYLLHVKIFKVVYLAKIKDYPLENKVVS